MPPDGDEISFRGYSIFHHIASILGALLLIGVEIILICPEFNPILRVIDLIIFVAVILAALYITVKGVIIH